VIDIGRLHSPASLNHLPSAIPKNKEKTDLGEWRIVLFSTAARKFYSECQNIRPNRGVAAQRAVEYEPEAVPAAI
jgi:hypothetical protein